MESELVELNRRLARLVADLENLTVRTPVGRKFVAVSAPTLVSHSYDEAVEAAIMVRERLFGSFGKDEPSSASFPVRSLLLARGAPAQRLGTALSQLLHLLAFPIDRHNEDNARRPAGPNDTLRWNDVDEEELFDALRSTQRALAEQQSSMPGGGRPKTGLEGGGFYSSADLALRHHVNPESLRKRLDRWRPGQLGDGVIENTERAANQPRFLYSEEAVLPLILALKSASDGTSERRPTEGNPTS